METIKSLTQNVLVSNTLTQCKLITKAEPLSHYSDEIKHITEFKLCSCRYGMTWPSGVTSQKSKDDNIWEIQCRINNHKFQGRYMGFFKFEKRKSSLLITLCEIVDEIVNSMYAIEQ